MPPAIAILDYGSGNLHSVSRAVVAAGGRPLVTADPAEAGDADAVVIPGVGHFGQCVRAIEDLRLDATIRDAVAAGTPVLGVCVGMQVLFERSDEDGQAGLGVLPGACRRLSPRIPGVKIPHMGWNEVSARRAHPMTAGIPDGTRFYFVHSYAPDIGDTTVGVTEHGRAFSASVAHGSVFATQFHPEKSGRWGLEIYRNFVAGVSAS